MFFIEINYCFSKLKFHVWCGVCDVCNIQYFPIQSFSRDAFSNLKLYFNVNLNIKNKKANFSNQRNKSNIEFKMPEGICVPSYYLPAPAQFDQFDMYACVSGICLR